MRWRQGPHWRCPCCDGEDIHPDRSRGWGRDGDRYYCGTCRAEWEAFWNDAVTVTFGLKVA